MARSEMDGIIITLISSIFIFFQDGYTANAINPPKECSLKTTGWKMSDPGDACYFFECDGRFWQRRLCLDGFGGVPKNARRHYAKEFMTRRNLCRKYEHSCVSSVHDIKNPNIRASYTPKPLPLCSPESERCDVKEQCCDIDGASAECFENKCTSPENLQCANIGEGCNGKHATNQGCCSNDPKDQNVKFFLQCDTNEQCCGLERQPCTDGGQCCKNQNLICKKGKCSIMDCPYPIASPNCRITSRSANNDNERFKVGERVYFNSDPCYSLDTSDESGEFVTCMPDGTVNPKIPRCKQMVCDKVKAPANGERDPSRGPDVCGSFIGFDCDSGYELKGAEEIRCREDGWTDVPPICEEEPEDEVCADLHEQCHRGKNGGNGLLPCCLSKNLKCSRTSTCCKDRGEVCSDGSECCIGLICTAQKECEPPISIVCEKPVDIVFAVDTSCSIVPKDKEFIRKFMTEMARAFELSTDPNRGVQMGALTFNQITTPVTWLNDASNPEKVITEIEHMELNLANEELCRTSTFDALKMTEKDFFSAEKGDRQNAKNTVVLLSDGATKPDNKQPKTFKNSDDLRKKAEIIVVALPQGCDPKKNKAKCTPKLVGWEEWNYIAGEARNVMSVNFTALRTVVKNLGTRVCGPNSTTIN